MRRSFFAVLVVALCTSHADAREKRESELHSREAFIEQKLDSLHGFEEILRRLMYKMPKGADFHSHLSGAVTTEHTFGKLGAVLEKRAQLIADPVFISVLAQTKRSIETSLKGARALLRRDTPDPDPGCGVGVRFIVSANRARDRECVFAQWVYGYELAQSSPTVVGIQLVSPEEHANSLLYYDDEMFALDVLRRLNIQDPERRPVHIALHAGELIPEVLPATPEGQRHLSFHIRHAVEIAHAERIGHGSALFDEEGQLDLFSEDADDRSSRILLEFRDGGLSGHYGGCVFIAPEGPCRLVACRLVDCPFSS